MPYFRNDSFNILFIHIPKTGGTSLEIYFNRKFKIPLNNSTLYGFPNEEIKSKSFINSSLQHIRYQTIIQYKDFFKIDFNNLTIITIVRNPYERLVSDLFFYKKISPDYTKEDVFTEIKKYLSSESIDNHNLPQHWFVTNEHCKLIQNIKILHTETLNTDIYNLGFTDFQVYVNCNLIKVNYYDYLNQDSIKLINEFYKLDFELFNYKRIIL